MKKGKEIEEIESLAKIGNFAEVQKAEVASCYNCMKTFEGSKASPHFEERRLKKGLSTSLEMTALCPFCGIDSCVPKLLSDSEMKELNDFFFKTFYSISQIQMK